MKKVTIDEVIQAQIDEDLWSDYAENRMALEYWDEVLGEEMSWQWYMEASVRRSEGWKYVVINPNHKVQTVTNWLNVNYPNCHYRTERNHMLIEDEQAAIMVALKFS